MNTELWTKTDKPPKDNGAYYAWDGELFKAYFKDGVWKDSQAVPVTNSLGGKFRPIVKPTHWMQIDKLTPKQ